MLGFVRPVVINTHVDSNKPGVLREKMAYAKVQQEAVGLAKFQLTSDIFESVFLSARPTNDIIDNDPCICSITNWYTPQCGKLLPNDADIVDETNKSSWPVGWYKWHYVVGPFNCIDPLKGKFFLACKCNGKLMISHGHINHPDELPHHELNKDCRIIPWLEGYVVNTEAPDKIIKILDVLLVGFGRKQCLEEPTPICDLSYVSNLGKWGFAFMHNPCLPLTIVDFLDCNGS
jgi:hypothetical protein